MTARAVSETIGFVLAFALVTSMIGITYASGFTGLRTAQQAEKVENMERAFYVLDDNLDDLHRQGAPSRGTEVQLSGGALDFGTPITITVNVTDTSDPSRNASYSMESEPISYVEDRTEIVYSAGAVFRTDGRDTVVLSEPDWLHSDDHAVITFVDTKGESPTIAGGTTLLIVADREFSKLAGEFNVTSGGTVRTNVTVESPRAAAWKQYFQDQGFTPVDADPGDDKVTYQFESDTVYVPKTKIRIEIER